LEWRIIPQLEDTILIANDIFPISTSLDSKRRNTKWQIVPGKAEKCLRATPHSASFAHSAQTCGLKQIVEGKIKMEVRRVFLPKASHSFSIRTQKP